MIRERPSTGPSGQQRPRREEDQGPSKRRLRNQERSLHDQHNVSSYRPLKANKHDNYNDHLNHLQRSSDDEDEDDWRRGAQMLSEQDELRLILGRDTTDAAPIRRAAQQRPTSRYSPDFSPEKQSKQRRSATATGRPSHEPSGATRKVIRRLRSASPDGRQRLLSEQFGESTSPSLNEPEVDVGRATTRRHDDRGNDDDADDNSSISFAQSGCHSILSAWRARAANRAARLTAAASRQPPRPVSVLSNASSTKKSVASTALTLASRAGKSPAARTRIPLGPQQAQHFVTNSRRRRRANELILSTLEARRRTLALNRQHLGSLFGSESYLLDAAVAGETYPTVASDYQRLSMSPSPQQHLPTRPRSKTPELHQQQVGFVRSALSDLGGVKHLGSAPTKRPVTANKLAKKVTQQKRPPLAKLDQNSSDLCSSNGSSDDDDESESPSTSSDGSQFTQLVTSELSPQCILLDEQVGDAAAAKASSQSFQQATLLRQRQLNEQQGKLASYWQQLKRLQSPNAGVVPEAPERTRKKATSNKSSLEANEQRANELGSFNDQRAQSQERQDNDDKFGGGGGAGNKFRRASLKRDSIRRLRLTRQQQQAAAANSESTNSSDNNNKDVGSSPQSTQSKLQQVDIQTAQRPSNKSRKLNIDSNPNTSSRQHFRSSSSTRSSDHSTGGGGREGSSPAAPTLLRRTMSPPPPLIRPASETTNQFRQRASLRLESQRAKATHDSFGHNDHYDDNVRQVEQMLRQMKPNQVFESKSRTTETRSTSGASNASRSNQQAHPANTTTTGSRRLISEGANTSDDVSFDMKGNRRQFELDERWRHDRIEPTRQPDGSLFSEDRLISQRVQVSRESSSAMLPVSSHIEPPAAFADNTSDHRRVSPAAQVRRRPADMAPKPQTPTRSKSPTANSQSRLPVQSEPRRAQSEERRRPVVPAKPVPRPSKTPNEPQQQQRQQVAATTSRRAQPTPIESPARRLDAARVLQASLPKFEPTADDEFRKRVDQLRQMAKANLREPPLASSSLTSTRRRPLDQPQQRQLTRPLSTNWDGVATSTSGPEERAPPPRLALERSKSSLESVGSSRLLQSQSASRPSPRVQPSSPATQVAKPSSMATNLDDMLLADRYQRPLNSSGWRRSNSSLASLSAPRSGGQRPSSPFGVPKQTTSSGGGSVLSQSVLSVGPTSGDCSPAMRLVVREKSAPKLDYAVRTEPALSPTPAKPATMTATSTTSVKTPPQPSQRAGAAIGPLPVQPRQLPPPTRTTPSRQPRVSSSPRSPELTFGAASSNDDSAIASSVSSPSLSYMINNPQTLVADGQRRSNPSQQRLTSPIQSINTTKQTSNPTVPSTATTTTTNTKQSANLTARTVSPTGGRQQSIDQARSAADNAGQSIGASSAAILPSILRRQQHLLNLEAARRLMATSESEQQQQHQERQPVAAASRLAAAFQPTSQQVSSYQVAPNIAGQAAPDRMSPSPLLIAQQQQHQVAEETGRKGVTTTTTTTTTTSDQQAASNPTKRVHFNDRASVRSFESVSSLNSNSTAVPLNGSLIRQQVGSPDSMGSGSTSRLSGGDSPDPRRGGGGAAIYAIRGDPDLENVESQRATRTPPVQQAPPVTSLAYPPLTRQQQQTRPMLLQSQQHQLLRQPMPLGIPAQPHPFIRMTAPPSMSSNPQQLQQQYYQQQLHLAQMSPGQYQVRPNSLVQPPAAMNLSSHMAHRQPLLVGRQAMGARDDSRHLQGADEEDDPDYALRLRQAAATTRAFSSYAQQQPLHSPGQQQAQIQMPPPAGRQTGGGGVRSRRAPLPGELASNFQTEV